MPYLVDEATFEELVVDALDDLPPDLAERIENIAVVVQDAPTPQQMRRHGLLLGLYQGVALTRRGPVSYNAVPPDRITIFRLPHCRISRTEEELRRRVRVTVLHEVGHHFGISDARLHELGWA